MSPSMLELLDLEELDRDLYRGINEIPNNDRPTLFGGQVAAQALMAAALTVPEGRYPHSMHGYFLRRGLRARPIIFNVERDRDGRSFSARRVSAVQDGAVIFDLTASFHVDEPSAEYVPSMPGDLPAPESCGLHGFSHNFPLAEARAVPPTRPDDEGNPTSDTLWVRVRHDLGENRLAHCCALVYLSDIGSGFANLEVDGLPHGGPSLDHAAWFRGPIRADRWTLLHMWPMMAGGSRGLYAGSMHAAEGDLGLMITQECLLRPAT